MTIYSLNGVSPDLPDEGDYWIAPDANVVGDVVISKDVSIWFGATLRGDTETLTIGSGSNIQENTVMHADPGFPVIIGSNCTIGHKAMIHGCVIGDGTLIGMGATILNGAKIGKGCLIGAGALITEGKEIPDGSLVMGMPGKIVRSLSDEDRAKNLQSAQHYQNRMRQYLDGLSKVSSS
ncbi:MAG: gamma carbonic anhydrase family protein [Boseongicola sp.]|nr:gamma carbonic anhydrase family protein [Boseongicola sp.]